MESSSMIDILRENTPNIEKCKRMLMNKQLIPMLSIKNIVAGSVGTVVPWIVLLIIVSIIILI
jgi:hypothetical protein